MLSYTKIQWIIMLIIFFLEVIWISLSSFQFYYNIRILFLFSPFVLFFSLLYLFYSKVRPDARIMMASNTALFFLIYPPLMTILSYLAATTNQPLVDPMLASMDNYVGFSSRDIVLMFRKHALLYNIFAVIYDTFLIQPYIILFYFCFIGRLIYLERFLMQFIVAMLLTVLIAGLFPAAGPYVWYQYIPEPGLQSALDRLYELRSNIVDIRQVDGIVTMPSFHTIGALLYAYTFRNEKKIIFIPILILNLLMIFSCLPIGEHYLSDVLTGIIVFGVTLGIEQLIFWGVTKPWRAPKLAFPKTKSTKICNSEY